MKFLIWLFIALPALALLPWVLIYVATFVALTIHPLWVIPALYILETPLIILWYRYKTRDMHYTFAPYKIKSTEDVITDYLKLVNKSGAEKRKTQT